MQSTYVEFSAPGVVTLREEDVSGDGLDRMEALIRNEASVISAGTELAGLHAAGNAAAFPKRSGYGSVGRIEAAGVGLSNLAVGERVFYAGKHASLQRFRHGENHQWGNLFRVPESLDPVDAAMGCMAEIAMTAPNVTEFNVGDTVAVFGLGLVGNLAAQIYRLRGARVIGVDPVKARGALARHVGIESVIDAPPDQQVDAVRALTGGQGAMVTVDASGIPEAVLNCVGATALFGQVVLVGTPRAPLQANVTALLNAIHTNGLVVRGAHMWRYPVRGDRNTNRSVEWAFATVFDLIASGRLRVRELVSHVVTPRDVPAAYEGLKNRPAEYSGVVIDWRQG